MKIRSITSFFDPRDENAYSQLDGLARFVQEGQQRPVPQIERIADQPNPD